MNSYEALTDHHEAGNMKYAIWGKIMDLDPVGIQQTMNKVVEGETKTLCTNSETNHEQSRPGVYP